MQTDPIADMLTRIRNALRIHAQSCTLPGSVLKVSVLDVLKREGYIEGYDVHAVPGKHEGTTTAKSAITVKLKYGPDGEDVITKLVRYSTPGCRRYRRVEKLPRPRAGLGIAIVSTSHGVLSDRECRQKRAGGEVLCTIE
jgi:small subunit ribosomal protein S8